MSAPEGLDHGVSRALLADWPVVIDATVAWGEMDAFGHVNNAVYFRYFESARIAYFDAIGYTDLMQQAGMGPILAETRCRFRAPLTYPDLLSVGARVSHTGDDHFDMKYAVASSKLSRIAAEGDGAVVCYDYRARQRAAMPGDIRRGIARLETGR